MMVWISVGSVMIFPLLFFNASIWFFSLFFFINLASGLSILLIFSKNQPLDLLIFLKGFSCLCLLQFYSDLSYFLSSARFWVFLILLLYSFNFDDRVSILDLSTLLMWALIAIYFFLDTALNVSQRFWYVVCRSHWFRRTLFLPSFRCLSSQHSRASCSVSMKLCSSELVSEFWLLTWLHCGLRDCLLWILFFCICWGVIYFQLCGQF